MFDAIPIAPGCSGDSPAADGVGQRLTGVAGGLTCFLVSPIPPGEPRFMLQVSAPLAGGAHCPSWGRFLHQIQTSGLCLQFLHVYNNHLSHRLADLSCGGPESQYFMLCGPCELHCVWEQTDRCDGNQATGGMWVSNQWEIKFQILGRSTLAVWLWATYLTSVAEASCRTHCKYLHFQETPKEGNIMP